ncbi:MAG TPA: serine/threonine-protein kinase [Mycobacterium sp.]|uniref:serine/threonine-protein kinase n=1 Tax=Mycobacterium sp. TaxID=1785 RepID=UPI002F412231
MPLVIGATAAGFSIVRQLGYEEFGELYVAEHPRLPRHQVLHLIPAETSVDLDYRARFDEESDLAAALWHPNIAGLTDRGEFEGQLWLSSEYIDGSDAAELLGEGHLDGLPPRMVIEIVSAIADALDYAHDRGVLHRYVNPGNILVSKSPADRRRIALTGLGVARPAGVNNTLTRAGMFIGTAGYTAPEQLMGDELDGRADQYALAASAFHLLTGAPPFAHFNPSVVVNRQLNDRAPRPSEIRPDLTEFDAIFARALSKDPVDRFRRARDFAKALESTGGTRSHIRATSELRAASIFREATDSKDPAPTTSFATPESDAVTPTAPSADSAPTTPAAFAAAASENGSAPAALPDSHVDDAVTSAGPTPPGDHVDDVTGDGAAEARKRRLKHSAAIGGVIVVVLLAWFTGVRALRTASQSNDTPTGVETTSAEPTAAVPALSTAPPAFIPPPPPPPMVGPRPVVSTPVTTLPTTTKPVPKVTTTAPAQTTVPQTTVPRSASPTTTTSPKPPDGLDTRPAVGMPCGPEGSSAVSNSGGPVNCVSTPGGFAWEPPGG